jgi:hypothetical protein
MPSVFTSSKHTRRHRSLPRNQSEQKPFFSSISSTKANPDKPTFFQPDTTKTNSTKSTLQTKSGKGETIASDQLSSRIEKNKGNGHSLPKHIQNEMESALSTDLKNVTIHTGAEATDLNKSLGSHAFTHGSDVYFNQGKYHPDSLRGKRLLAHELTHVKQQKGGGSS